MQVHCTTRKVEIYDSISGILGATVADGKADTANAEKGQKQLKTMLFELRRRAR